MCAVGGRGREGEREGEECQVVCVTFPCAAVAASCISGCSHNGTIILSSALLAPWRHRSSSSSSLTHKFQRTPNLPHCPWNNPSWNDHVTPSSVYTHISCHVTFLGILCQKRKFPSTFRASPVVLGFASASGIEKWSSLQDADADPGKTACHPASFVTIRLNLDQLFLKLF